MDADRSYQALTAWITAIEWDLVDVDKWTAWAFAEIAKPGQPPIWVIDLSTSGTKDEALTRLYDSRKRLDGPRMNQLHLTLGLLFARYLAAKITLEELLRTAGLEADKANASDPPCESYYGLLTALERGRSKTETEQAARPFFEDHLREAKRLLSSVSIELP